MGKYEHQNYFLKNLQFSSDFREIFSEVENITSNDILFDLKKAVSNETAFFMPLFLK